MPMHLADGSTTKLRQTSVVEEEFLDGFVETNLIACFLLLGG